MIGLTRLRDETGAFPFVEQLDGSPPMMQDDAGDRRPR
jgi:hypothetical protein